MAFNVSHLPSPIAARLRQFYYRKRLLALLRVVFAVLIVYALAIFVLTHIDRFVFLSEGVRLAFLIATHTAAALLAGVGLFFWHWKRPDARAIAYELEQALGGAAEERIVTLQDVLRHQPMAASVDSNAAAATAPPPSSVGQRLVEQLRTATIRFSEAQQAVGLVRDPWAARLGIVTAVLLGIGLLMAIPASYQWPLMVKRFYMPTAALARPSFIKIQVTPAETETIGRGGELVVQARLDDQTPGWIAPVMDLLGATAGRVRLDMAGPEVADLPPDEQSVYMSRVQADLFLHTRSELQDDLRFTLRTGNAQAGPIDVDVVVQPSVTDLAVHVTPPDYTDPEGSPEPQLVENPLEPINILRTASVSIAFSSDQQIVSGRLEPVEGGEPIELDWDSRTNTGTYRFEPLKSVTYRLIVVAEHGGRQFENVDRPTVSIGVSEDLPPTITLRYPPGEFTAVGPQIVPIEGVMEDNLGVESAAVTYIVNPNPVEEQSATPNPIDLGENAGAASIDLDAQIDLAETGAAPGDTVLVQVRATDAAGGEATSRAVLIRIVPFSRGEHERQRLAALDATARALRQFIGFDSRPAEDDADGGNVEESDADQASQTQPKPLSIDRAIDEFVWNAMADIITGAGAPIPDDETLASIFELLELEHDLTERFIDRVDMRRLVGLLRIAAEPRLRGRTTMLDQLDQLTGEIIPRLRDYRLGRNLNARYFGLRNEANRLKAELQTRPDGSSPNVAAIDRRTNLYLDALQATNEDLLGLARRSDAIDVAPLETQTLEMNTAAFLLSGGGLARRRRAVDQLQESLTTIIELVRGALPALHRRAMTGSDQLREAYRSAATRALESLDASPDDESRAAAKRWLEAEQRMLDKDPFAPIGPRVARIAMLQALGRHPQDFMDQADWTNGAEEVREAGSGPDARVLADLARQWRLLRLINADLPTDELSVGLAIAQMEAAGGGHAEPSAAWREAADRLLAVEIAPADAPISGTTIKLSDLRPAGNAREAIRSAGEAVRQRHSDPDVSALLDRAIQSNIVAQSAIEALSQSMQGEQTQVVGKANEAQAALSRAAATSNGALAVLAARLNLVPGSSADAERVDALRQEWAEAYNRFAARTATGREVLRAVAGGQSTADQLSRLAGEIARLTFLHESWSKQVVELKGKWVGDDEEAEPLASGDPLLKQTRRLAAIALVQQPDPASRERALNALQQFDAAAGMWLNSWADEAQRAVEAIAEARRAMAAETVDADVVRDNANRAAAELERIVEALRFGESNAEIARALTEITPVQRMAEQLAEMPVDSEAAVSRARYVAADLEDDLDLLTDNLAQAGGRTEQRDYFRFAFRPWTKLYENDIRYREQQLDSFVGQARRQALLGVLVALRDQPDAQAFETGYAWIAAAYRIARSDLYSPGRTTGGGGGPTPPPDFFDFLLDELRDSRQQPDVPYWRDRINPYLDVVEDVIRFYEQ